MSRNESPELAGRDCPGLARRDESPELPRRDDCPGLARRDDSPGHPRRADSRSDLAASPPRGRAVLRAGAFSTTDHRLRAAACAFPLARSQHPDRDRLSRNHSSELPHRTAARNSGTASPHPGTTARRAALSAAILRRIAAIGVLVFALARPTWQVIA